MNIEDILLVVLLVVATAILAYVVYVDNYMFSF